MNQLRWSFEDGYDYPYDKALLPTGEDLFHDPHVTFLWGAPLDIVKKHRDVVNDVFSNLRTSRVVVITLGLVEAWWDFKSELYLNQTPPIAAVKADPGRFRLDILSYDDVLSAFEQCYEILCRVCPPNFRLILTVSPVPLDRTFTDHDIILANNYSKSVLRAAAQEIFYSHDNGDYFPSYEMVTHTERAFAWQSDKRHVSPEMVEFIIMRLLKNYQPQDDDEDTPSGAERVPVRELV